MGYLSTSYDNLVKKNRAYFVTFRYWKWLQRQHLVRKIKWPAILGTNFHYLMTSSRDVIDRIDNVSLGSSYSCISFTCRYFQLLCFKILYVFNTIRCGHWTRFKHTILCKTRWDTAKKGQFLRVDHENRNFAHAPPSPPVQCCVLDVFSTTTKPSIDWICKSTLFSGGGGGDIPKIGLFFTCLISFAQGCMLKTCPMTASYSVKNLENLQTKHLEVPAGELDTSIGLS